MRQAKRIEQSAVHHRINVTLFRQTDEAAESSQVVSVERDAFVPARARWRLRGRVGAPVFVRAAAFRSISNTYRFAHHFSSVFST